MYRGKGKITICPRRSTRLDCVAISVEDDKSGVQFLEIEIDLESFARAIMGLGNQKCDIEVRGAQLIGCRRETKTVKVTRPGYRKDNEEAQRILALFTRDGWSGRSDDLWNHHNWVSDNRVEVVFIRFIDTAGKPVMECSE